MSGFSPLDLLSFEGNEQKVLRCLSERPELTIAEIAAATQIPIDDLRDLLNRMVNELKLVEQLKDNDYTFSVRFKREQKQVRNLPRGILNIFEQSPLEFLADVPLMESLSEEERAALLARSAERKLMSNEVFTWQGKHFSHVGLVRNGILKKSRLQSQAHTSYGTRYVHRSEWVGLSQALSGFTSLYTFTALSDSELLLWPIDSFVEFMKENRKFGMAVSQRLSEQLNLYEEQAVHGLGELWAVEAVGQRSGATTLAVNLAALIAKRNDTHERKAGVVLWGLRQDDRAIHHLLGLHSTAKTSYLPGVGTLSTLADGLQVLLKPDHKDYSAQVQADVLLANLQEKFDYIICDTGSSLDEVALYVRGQAHTLVTVTTSATQVGNVQERWSKLQPNVRPLQKRLLALNRVENLEAIANPDIHIVLPEDKNVAHALDKGVPVVEFASDSAISHALCDVYLRLSLGHTVGIFIPTGEPNQEVGKAQEIQSTLSFLTRVFGVPTRSEVKSTWRGQENEVAMEQVAVVRTLVSKAALEEHLDDVINFAARLKQELGQEVIVVNVDKRLILV